MGREEEDENEGPRDAAVRRTQLGELRDEITQLEKQVGAVNTRIKTLVDGNMPEPDRAPEKTTTLEARIIPSLTLRVKQMKLRLQNGALERLNRLGSD